MSRTRSRTTARQARSARSRNGWAQRSGHARARRRNVIAAASTATFRSSTRSAISFKESSSSRNSARGGPRQSCSYIALLAAGGSRHMAKRIILMLALMTAFIAALGLVKVRQFQAMAKQFAAMQAPPDAVTTIVVKQEDWPATL